MPAEGRDLRWKRWRKGAGSREWPTAYHPEDEQEFRTSSHAQAKGTTLSGRRRQGVNRPDDAPAGRRKGASRVPQLARPTRSPRPGNPCASRMIPLESPVPEIGPPGSESGGRKRAYGSRTAARCESAGMSHRALPVTRLPSTLHESGWYPRSGRGDSSRIIGPATSRFRGETRGNTDPIGLTEEPTGRRTLLALPCTHIIRSEQLQHAPAVQCGSRWLRWTFVRNRAT